MSALTLGLYFSGLFVFVTPLPYVFFYLKYGKTALSRAVWPSVVVVAIIYLFGIDFFKGLYQEHPASVWLFPVPILDLIRYFSPGTVRLLGLSYFAVYLIMGYLIVESLQAPQSRAMRMLPLSVVGLCLGILMLVAIAILGHWAEALTAYRQDVALGIGQTIESFEKAGLSVSESVRLKSQIPVFVDYLTYLMPSFILAAIAVIFVINLAIARRLFVRGKKATSVVNLTEFRLPFFLVWMFVGLGLMLVINQKLLGSQGFHFLCLNILISLGVAYFFQGLAVFGHFLNRRNVVGFSRLLIYGTLFLLLLYTLHLMIAVLVILGFADNWLDVRKLDSPKKS